MSPLARLTVPLGDCDPRGQPNPAAAQSADWKPAHGWSARDNKLKKSQTGRPRDNSLKIPPKQDGPGFMISPDEEIGCRERFQKRDEWPLD